MLFARKTTMALLVLSLITIGLYYWGQTQKRLAVLYGTQYDSTVLALEHEREESRRVRLELNAVQERYRAQERNLERALKEHPDWSSTAVPPDVKSGLCNASNCSPMQTSN